MAAQLKLISDLNGGSTLESGSSSVEFFSDVQIRTFLTSSVVDYVLDYLLGCVLVLTLSEVDLIADYLLGCFLVLTSSAIDQIADILLGCFLVLFLD